MNLPLLYTLFVCVGLGPPCATPHGLTPTLTRQQCIEEMWMTRALDHSKRVVCFRPDHMGIGPPDDVVDSAGILRPEWEEVH